MITLTRNAASSPVFPLAKSSADSSANSQKFDNSFTQQLVSALEGYLSQNQNATHVDISIDAQPGQNSGTRQFLVTVKDSAPAPSPAPSPAGVPAPVKASAAAVAPAIPDSSGNLMYSGTPVLPVPATLPSGPPPITNEADAYWAMQPPEVQELRKISDFHERGTKARELADKGFAIDSDIMVYGDDPYITMRYRQDMGYTWIPSMGQSNIPVAPGLKFPGLPSYDPSKPPTGSIGVTTAFAKGLEASIPWGGVAWMKST